MRGSAVPPRAALDAVERAVVYHREPAPDGVDEARREADERLDELRRRGALDDVATTVWDESGPVDAGRASLPELLQSFANWTREHDRSLHPAYRRVAAATVESERSEDVRPPLLCLACYGDGELLAVYPHSEGSIVHTVRDGLEALTAAAAPGEPVA